jgi:hypothetical protein
MIFSYALAATFIIHGLAHVSGFTTAWTSKNADFKDEPWLFAKGIPLHTRAGKTFGLLWLLAAVLLIASGIGLLLIGQWWPTLALIGSVASLVAIVPWWRAVVPGAKVGAAFGLFTIAVLISPIREGLLAALAGPECPDPAPGYHGGG